MLEAESSLQLGTARCERELGQRVLDCSRRHRKSRSPRMVAHLCKQTDFVGHKVGKPMGQNSKQSSSH